MIFFVFCFFLETYLQNKFEPLSVKTGLNDVLDI